MIGYKKILFFVFLQLSYISYALCTPTYEELLLRAKLDPEQIQAFSPDIINTLSRITEGNDEKTTLYVFPGRSPTIFARLMLLKNLYVIGIPLSEFRENLNGNNMKSNSKDLIENYLIDYLEHDYYFDLSEIRKNKNSITKLVYMDFSNTGQSLFSFYQHASPLFNKQFPNIILSELLEIKIPALGADLFEFFKIYFPENTDPRLTKKTIILFQKNLYMGRPFYEFMIKSTVNDFAPYGKVPIGLIENYQDNFSELHKQFTSLPWMQFRSAIFTYLMEEFLGITDHSKSLEEIGSILTSGLGDLDCDYNISPVEFD
ncbi:MAG: hypothetical protein QE271_08250 [Bacteriovoracaceae bacterium]|nr:hypothetical protein [Bacteriovoracaceae bacterium]